MQTRGTRSDTRRDAMAAARRLLEPRLDLVGDLADPGAAIEVAEEALHAAEQALLQARQSYLDRHRDAVKGGWSEPQLAAAGCPADRGRARVGTRRSRPGRSDRNAGAGSNTPTGTPTASSASTGTPDLSGTPDRPGDLAPIGARSSP